MPLLRRIISKNMGLGWLESLGIRSQGYGVLFVWWVMSRVGVFKNDFVPICGGG